jgi:hypothetical protein
VSPLVPPPENLPVAWVWLKTLLMTLFPLHLLFMNAMIGSIAIAIYCGLRRDERSRELSLGLAKIIPFLAAFAVNLGVASLLFIQVLYGRLFYTSSILMAVFWLAVIPLLMIAYYLLYLFDFRYARLGRCAVPVAAIALSLLMTIAFIYSNNMTLMLAPGRWSAYLANRGGTVLNLAEPMLLPRYLHFMIGGMAVGGLFVALYGKFLVKKGKPAGETAIRTGMLIFMVLTLLQAADGLWFLQSLPDVIRREFMGGNAVATAHFFTGVFLALLALMAASVRSVYGAASISVPLVFVMASIRDSLRTAFLRPFFVPDHASASPQYTPMIIFFFIFAIGVIAIAWMLVKGAVSSRD